MLMIPARSTTRLAERRERERRRGSHGRFEKRRSGALIRRAALTIATMRTRSKHDEREDERRLDDRHDDRRNAGVALHRRAPASSAPNRKPVDDHRERDSSRASSATAIAV